MTDVRGDEDTTWLPAPRWRALRCAVRGHRWTSQPTARGIVLVLCERCREVVRARFLDVEDVLWAPPGRGAESASGSASAAGSSVRHGSGSSGPLRSQLSAEQLHLDLQADLPQHVLRVDLGAVGGELSQDETSRRLRPVWPSPPTRARNEPALAPPRGNGRGPCGGAREVCGRLTEQLPVVDPTDQMDQTGSGAMYNRPSGAS